VEFNIPLGTQLGKGKGSGCI